MAKYFKELNNNLSGTGNGALQVEAARSYYGRKEQYGTLRVTADNWQRVSTTSLKLKGADEFINLDSSTVTVGEDGRATISGTSNVKNLSLAATGVTVVSTKINGNSTQGLWDGGDKPAIPGDPGLEDAFQFEMVVAYSGPRVEATLSNGLGLRRTVTIASVSPEVFEKILLIDSCTINNYISSAKVLGRMKLSATIPWILNMDNAFWIQASPQNGTAGADIDLIVPENTGRMERTARIVAEEAVETGENLRSEYSITQQGAELFATLSSIAEGSIDNVDENDSIILEYVGRTNCHRFNSLSFTNLVGGTAEFYSLTTPLDSFDATETFPIVLDESNGVGDAFDFKLCIKVTMSSGATNASGDLALGIGVSASNSVRPTAQFGVIATGEESLRISENTVILESDGAAKSIDVISTVDWEIVPQE